MDLASSRCLSVREISVALGTLVPRALFMIVPSRSWYDVFTLTLLLMEIYIWRHPRWSKHNVELKETKNSRCSSFLGHIASYGWGVYFWKFDRLRWNAAVHVDTENGGTKWNKCRRGEEIDVSGVSLDCCGISLRFSSVRSFGCGWLVFYSHKDVYFMYEWRWLRANAAD